MANQIKAPLYMLLLLLMAIANACTPAKRFSEKPLFIPIETPESNTTSATPVKSPFALRKKFIVIDPGHGGEDDGTQSTSKPIYKEKTMNLATSQILEVYLQQMGYRTELTRKNDKFVTLDGRATFANELNPDLFVSIHFNSAPSAKAHGIEVFYYRTEQETDRSITSKILAEKVLQKVLVHTEAKSRGVKHGNLAVIRKTTMPAILIEGGFLTNEQEFQKLRDSAYIKKLAWGIAQGIQDFLNRKST